MLATGSSGLGLLLAGLIAKNWNINTAWLVSGLIIICLMPLVMIFNSRYHTKLNT